MIESDPIAFEATIQSEGKFIFVALPFAPREVWGARPRYHVQGTIDHVPVRGTLGASGQAYFLSLAAAWLRDSGLEPGTRVSVTLSIQDRTKGS